MTEEKPRKCHRDGCDSAARWGVLLHLNCVAPGLIVPAHLKCSIEVCDKHKEEAMLRGYVLSDENKEKLTTHLMEEAGHPEPDFLTARFEFFPVARSVIEVRQNIPTPKCDRVDCKAPATHQIVFRFRLVHQKGKGEPVISSLTSFVVCGTHKEITDRTAFREVGAIESTREMFSQRGITGVDFRTMEIGFVDLNSGAELNPKTGRIDARKWVGDGQPFDLNPQLALDPEGKPVN